MWGCVAFYKVPDSQRFKLGPRGIKSVFIGYAQNSKAYRLLNIESNIIVESVHVEFFENKFLYDHIVHDSEIDVDQNISNANDPLDRNKRKEVDESFAPRRSQRIIIEKHLDPDFVSLDSITFLVEGNEYSFMYFITLPLEYSLYS